MQSVHFVNNNLPRDLMGSKWYASRVNMYTFFWPRLTRSGKVPLFFALRSKIPYVLTRLNEHSRVAIKHLGNIATNAVRLARSILFPTFLNLYYTRTLTTSNTLSHHVIAYFIDMCKIDIFLLDMCGLHCNVFLLSVWDLQKEPFHLQILKICVWVWSLVIRVECHFMSNFFHLRLLCLVYSQKMYTIVRHSTADIVLKEFLIFYELRWFGFMNTKIR